MTTLIEGMAKASFDVHDRGAYGVDWADQGDLPGALHHRHMRQTCASYDHLTNNITPEMVEAALDEQRPSHDWASEGHKRAAENVVRRMLTAALTAAQED